MATKEVTLRIPEYTLGRLDQIATKKKSTRHDVLTELIVLDTVEAGQRMSCLVDDN
ncbi:MAG: hypothetical protein H8E47_04865 [Anaerolineales bacterium]|nr:hypothetical protein [Anaerolineales bacterium]